MKLRLVRAFPFFLLAAPALATDYYVDAVHGNDANAGTTPASAWKTIMYAAATATAGPTSVIHLAPGTYSSASGEVFPLHFLGQEVVGDAGSPSTVIDAGGAVAIELRQVYSPHQGPQYPSYVLPQMTGVTARNASTFALMSTEWLDLDAHFSDVRLENVTGTCFDASGSHGPGLMTAWGFQLILDHVDCSLAHSGTLVALTSNTGQGTLFASDCDFSNAPGWGVESGSTLNIVATFDRCRFTHDTGYAFIAQNAPNGAVTATFRDCLVAHNGYGIYLDSGNPMASSTVHIERCTITDNAFVGVSNTGTSATTTIDSTIVTNNLMDLNTLSPSIQFSWITAGNPSFVDPSSDDYRLRFGSPCVDQGHVGSGSGAPDLAGVVRPIDGDLDTQKRADIGAYELTPLRLVTSGHLGAPLRLESSGPAGGTSTIYFTRSAPALPMATPFGELELNPSMIATLLHTSVAPFPPIGFQRPVPNLPALVGHTFAFQGLTTSSLAPQGSAYTNVVSFTVLP